MTKLTNSSERTYDYRKAIAREAMTTHRDHRSDAPSPIPSDAPLSPAEIEHRRKAMLEAIASAQLSGCKINEDTRGLMTLFMLGEIREDEMMARIHAIYGASATPEGLVPTVEALSRRELALIEAAHVEEQQAYGLTDTSVLEGLSRRG